MALDEPKDTDRRFEFGPVSIVVDQTLYSRSGDITIDFKSRSICPGYRIDTSNELPRPDHCSRH